VTLSEALSLKYELQVSTIDTVETIKLQTANLNQYSLQGKGINGGDHHALVRVKLPRGSDREFS